MHRPLAALTALAAALTCFAQAARAEDLPAPPSDPAQAPAQSEEAPPIIHVDAPRARIDQDPDAALVFIGDDGGLNPQAVRAMRGLAIGQLRKRGVPVVDDARAEGVIAPEAARRLMRELGVGRAFSVEVQGRLGSKLPLQLEELAPDRAAPLFAAGLTAGSLEECDIVIPRLVNAVLDRRAPEDNAEMATVTRKESQPFRKRPGELHWSLGLVIPTFEGSDSSGTPVGLSTQLFYEIEHFNLGVEALFGSNRGLTAGGLFFQGNWLPIDGEVSPYIGVGLGYMGADANWGLGLKVQVGVEALRLHQVRVLAGFEALIPFFDTSEDAFDSGSSGNPSRSFLPMLFLQFSL